MTRVTDKLRSRLRKYRKNIWLLDGNERHSQQPLQIVYAGRELNKNYIAHLAYGDAAHEEYRGKTWLWTLPRLLATYRDTDLIICEEDAHECWRLRSRSDFYVPCWINSEFPLPLDQEIARHRESVRSDIRAVRKYGYSYEIARDTESYRLFYETMYAPYIVKAHGNRAALMSLEELMSRRETTDLLLIRRDGQYVAGEVLVYEHEGVRSWSLGVKDGDYRYVKEGVLGAIYYFKMQYLAERGFNKLNAGASRPFLDDGVLQYKKKWGAQLTTPRPGGLLLRVVSRAPGLVAFLQNNPFIGRQGSALNGVVFWPEGTEVPDERKSRITKTLWIPGLDGLGIYYVQQRAECDLVAHIERLDAPGANARLS